MVNHNTLEIKPCRLGSRIRDIEEELMDGWMWDKLILVLKCQSVRQDLIFLASTTSEVKNYYVHVITQEVCNNFIETKFSVGCMVWT